MKRGLAAVVFLLLAVTMVMASSKPWRVTSNDVNRLDHYFYETWSEIPVVNAGRTFLWEDSTKVGVKMSIPYKDTAAYVVTFSLTTYGAYNWASGQSHKRRISKVAKDSFVVYKSSIDNDSGWIDWIAVGITR